MYDPALMVEALGSFLHNIDVLFLHEDVLSQGHTELMLQHLRKERVARLPTGLKTLGGQGKVTNQMIKTCLDRMAAWVVLATKRLEAEFPEHQTLQAFRVFDLSYQRFQESEQADRHSVRVQELSRLAQVFGVNADELRNQFNICFYNAQNFLRSGKAKSNLEAWIMIRKKFEERVARKQGNLDLGALDVVLARYCAFQGCSTSRVEQSFSVFERIVCKERAHMQLSMQEGFLRLGLCGPDLKVAQDAARVRMKHYGRPRLCQGPRVRSTIPEKVKGSESAWRDNCKAQAKHLSKLHKKRSKAEIIASAGQKAAQLWTAQRDEESKTVEELSRANRLQGLMGNELLPQEVAAKQNELLEDCEKRLKRVQEHDREHANKWRKIAENSRRMTHDLQGAKILVDFPPDCQDISFHDVVQSFLRRNIQLAGPRGAQYYLLPSMEMQPSASWFYAVCAGRCVCNCEFVLSGGVKGVCLAYQPAILSRRKICLTDEFRRAHPDECTVLEEVSTEPTSKWKITSELQFLEAMANRKASESAFYQMALVTNEMKQSDAVYKARANAFTMLSFLKFFAKADVPRCREGVCGR